MQIWRTTLTELHIRTLRVTPEHSDNYYRKREINDEQHFEPWLSPQG
jgi:hypothetical protein